MTANQLSAVPLSAVPHALGQLSGQHFQALVGEPLCFLRPGMDGAPREAVELTLLDVRVSRFQGVRGKRQPFSLLMTLRDAAPLDDRRLHTLVHADFEPCELLLSRVSVPELDQRDGTMYYELIFG